MSEAVPAPAADATQTDLIARLVAGERRAVAAALTRLERQGEAAGDLLAGLAPHVGRALVVGITGPPGAGKSTLVNALIAHLRGLGDRVAVVAVDPSSPLTGGAILGDRIRMTAALDDDGVVVRSLASRGTLGGLTPAAVRMIDALDAAGFAHVLLETVGTGQSEIDVAEVADVRVVVAAPGLGDGIQAMKAGLLEIADIMVVNKADREGAERTLQQLKGALAMGTDRRDVPVLKTAAVSGTGVAELAAAIGAIGTERLAEGVEVRRRRRARYLIARAAAELVAHRIRQSDARRLQDLADEVLSGALSPEAAAARVIGG